MSRQLCDNPFKPQLPSWLLAKVPPPVITLDVVPLLATEDLLPSSWAKRKRRIENLLRRDQRGEANFLRRIDRIAGLLEIHKCPKCGGQSLRVRSDGHSETHECRFVCGYLQVWSLKPPLEIRTEPRPQDFVTVPLYSRFTGRAFLLHLVHEYGYDFEAASSSFALCFTYHRPEKRKPQPLPEATRDALMKAISRSKTRDPNMRLAVHEVTVLGKRLNEVAKRHGLNPESLRKSIYRTYKRREVAEAAD